MLFVHPNLCPDDNFDVNKKKKKEFVSISPRPTEIHSWPIFSQMTLDEDDEKYTSHGLKKKKKNLT